MSDTDETPQKKRCKVDPEFVLETPDRRRSTEFCSCNGAFVAQKSQLQAFVGQINSTSRCATQGCEGLLKPVSVHTVGFGGSWL